MTDQALIQLKRQNYKAMHTPTAKDKGVYEKFKNASTITQMKKILWGTKMKNTTCCKDGCHRCGGKKS